MPNNAHTFFVINVLSSLNLDFYEYVRIMVINGGISMSEWHIKTCPSCGQGNFGIGYQIGQASMSTSKMGLSGSRIEHQICRNCGLIVASRVEKPNIFKVEVK